MMKGEKENISDIQKPKTKPGLNKSNVSLKHVPHLVQNQLELHPKQSLGVCFYSYSKVACEKLP